MSDENGNGQEEWQPTWLYRLGEGNKAEGKLFEDGPPEDMKGWYDNPNDVPKRGRPPKEEDGS